MSIGILRLRFSVSPVIAGPLFSRPLQIGRGVANRELSNPTHLVNKPGAGVDAQGKPGLRGAVYFRWTGIGARRVNSR